MKDSGNRAVRSAEEWLTIAGGARTVRLAAGIVLAGTLLYVLLLPDPAGLRDHRLLGIALLIPVSLASLALLRFGKTAGRIPDPALWHPAGHHNFRADRRRPALGAGVCLSGCHRGGNDFGNAGGACIRLDRHCRRDRHRPGGPPQSAAAAKAISRRSCSA
ncbi:MAG: hypothetical protein M5R42_02110 [Rhodocyclaceae bacterium]|nr:hypothetical protein [Rhodocyclaceae bacterium]